MHDVVPGPKVPHLRQPARGHPEGSGAVRELQVRVDVDADDVVVRFDDGSECVFHDPDVERLIPAEDSSLFPDEEQCAYFPGLVVHASTSALRSATWTRGRTNR